MRELLSALGQKKQQKEDAFDAEKKKHDEDQYEKKRAKTLIKGERDFTPESPAEWERLKAVYEACGTFQGVSRKEVEARFAKREREVADIAKDKKAVEMSLAKIRVEANKLEKLYEKLLKSHEPEGGILPAPDLDGKESAEETHSTQASSSKPECRSVSPTK